MTQIYGARLNFRLSANDIATNENSATTANNKHGGGRSRGCYHSSRRRDDRPLRQTPMLAERVQPREPLVETQARNTRRLRQRLG